jgi:hypothetical protein
MRVPVNDPIYECTDDDGDGDCPGKDEPAYLTNQELAREVLTDHGFSLKPS